MAAIHLMILIILPMLYLPYNVSANDQTVIIPLWSNKKIVGNATPADVLDGKTFTSSEGEQTGKRPPAPLATDNIGPGVQAPKPRFEVVRGIFVAEPQEGYGVQDKLTGLIWRLTPESEKTYTEARDYCDNLSTQYLLKMGTRPITVDDWRLPSVREMESLLDYSRAAVTVSGSNALAIPNYFTDVFNGEYWTDSLLYWVDCDTPDTYACLLSYLVDIQQGTTRQQIFKPGDENEPTHYFWCVRGVYEIYY